MARHVEDLGIDRIIVPWHVAVSTGEWERNMGPRWPNPVAAAGVMIGATQRITVMPLAVVPCLEPIDLAKAWATLSWMSDGRRQPVLLAGYIKWEFDLLGADFDRRDDVTDEYTAAMQSLWRGESDLSGQFLQYADVVFDPVPRGGGMPLWFGGGSRRSLQRIAAMGEGWLTSTIPHDDIPEYICSRPGWQA